jgi:hypothetical protein
MSSPIHHAKDLDAALTYAPPWAREQGTREPLRPSVALARGQQRRRPIALSAYEYSGDRDMARLQRQLALDPDRVPEPPTETVRTLLPMVGRLCGVGCVAAAVAWVMMSYPGMRWVRSDVVRVAASAPQPEIVAPKSDPLRTETGAGLLLQHGLAVAAPAPPPADNRQPAVAAAPSLPQRSVETVPVTAAPTVSIQPNANRFSSDDKRAPIDSDEIATLLKRGKQALTEGDLAAARLLLRRAADGGSADAAFALGTTFDKAVLRQLHAVGAEADAVKAREWYEKAAQLGSSAATEKLAKASQ